MRLDKWLWAARFFKTRALAAAAITGGKVHVNGSRTKPAKAIRVGDRLTVRRGPYEWTVTVHGVAEARRPAAEAVALYDESIESARERERLAAEMAAHATRPSGERPSKKARRDLERFLISHERRR